MSEGAVLLLHSADRKGLVATIGNFLFSHGGNILHADQHQDAELGLFIRIEWSLHEFGCPAARPVLRGTVSLHSDPRRQKSEMPGSYNSSCCGSTR